MATLYAKNVTGNWNAATSWSATGSGGGDDAGVPDATTDCVFDALFTGSITLTASTTVNSVVCSTGAAGTLTHNASVTLTIDGQDAGGDSLKFVSTMTYTHNTETSVILFSGSGTSKITSGTIVIGRITLNNAGDTFQLQDPLTLDANSTNAAIYQLNGTLDTNGQTVTLTGSVSRILSGGSTVTFTSLTKTGTANKTDRLILAADIAVTGTLTINGNSSINRILVQSETLGTAVTITNTNDIVATNCDFRDIAITNATDLSASAGGSGDCGGNTGITFTTADDWYFKETTNNGTAGRYNFSEYTNWYTATNGGGSQMGATLVPLPQDSCFYDTNSFSATIDRITVDLPRIPKNDFTGVTETLTFGISQTATAIYGSLIFVNNMDWFNSSTSNRFGFEGRGTSLYTNADSTYFSGYIDLNMFGGTLQITDSISVGSADGARGITLNYGTLDCNTNNPTITCAAFNSSNSNTRTLTMGSGTWTITSSWNIGTTTNLTGFNANTSTILWGTATSTTARTFDGGGLSYNNLSIVANTTGTQVMTLTGSNTFNAFTINAPKTVKFTAGTTQYVNSFVIVNDAANIVNLQSTVTDTIATISDLNGGTNVNDYLDVLDIVANEANTFYYGANGSADAESTNWLESPSGGVATGFMTCMKGYW